jgi:peptidoglycan/LPS O-acetylase OafA/YrhL
MNARSGRLAYLPGVDGLRAVAVIAVFLFHAGVLDGGFIGVDVFFVISGYLITALAISEIERNGRLGLGAFWARRARRLLPALMLVCGAVLVYSIAEGGAALRRVGRDITATILYVANWAQIGAGRDYFAAYDAPPLLQHAWSLAVEEQFYLVWPLVLTAVVFALRGRTRWLRSSVGAVALAAAAASVGISYWLKSQDASLGRLYFGTDTRAVGLAIGSVAGCVIRPSTVPSRESPARMDVVGAAGAITLLAMMVWIDGSERWLYGAGFLVIALASLSLMTAAMGAGLVARLLSIRPLVALGRVSYGFYLWHWPVIVVLDAERTGLSGPVLGALWVVVTAALTACSWFVIERPAPLPTIGLPRRAIGYVAVGAVLIGGSLAATAVGNNRLQTAAFTVPVAPTVASTVAPTSSVPSATVATVASDAPTTTSISPTTTSMPVRTLPVGRPLRVLIIGDSVARSLTSSLTEEHVIPGFGDVEVLNVGNIACPVIEAGEWWMEAGGGLRVPAECDGPDRYESEIDSFRPDVVYALFGWTGGGGGQRLDDGSILTPCQPAFDQLWHDDYQRLVDRVEDRAIVVVSTVAPADIQDEGHDAPTRCLNAAVGGLDANVFDYGGWLCPDYDCSTSTDLRADKVHFTDNEALRRQVVESVLAQVLPVAGY